MEVHLGQFCYMSVTVREECSQGAFENSVLRTVFGSKWEGTNRRLEKIV